MVKFRQLEVGRIMNLNTLSASMQQCNLDLPGSLNPTHKTSKLIKTMGQSKVMPLNSRQKATLLIYLRHMIEKLVKSLRYNQLRAQQFYIGWKSYEHGWIGNKCVLPCPTYDGHILFEFGKAVLEHVWNGEPVYQVQITALDPQPEHQQYDLFIETNHKHEFLNAKLASVSERCGQVALKNPSLLEHSQLHNFISSSWRAQEHRQPQN